MTGSSASTSCCSLDHVFWRQKLCVYIRHHFGNSSLSKSLSLVVKLSKQLKLNEREARERERERERERVEDYWKSWNCR